ncbi:MAG: 50S ribosomal protein L23 [Bacilli bacterium]|nr:50S ribosomal protein L23 [Bacilli bacterium]
MAEEKENLEVVEQAAEKPAKKAARKPKAKKAEEPKKPSFAKPTAHDFEVIVAPLITEKSMALMQNANKVTVKVAEKSNKVEIKEAFQRIFQVKVTDVKVVHQIGKTTTRGGRYKGTISGFKKAVVTIAEGEAIDLFKE